MRVAWFATFAVHILDMACKVMYSSATLWEAPGTRGALTIQFGPPLSLGDISPFSKQLSLQVTAENMGPSLVTTYYYLHEAIKSELAEIPHIPTAFYPCFYRVLIHWLGRSVLEINVTNSFRRRELFVLSGLDREAAKLRVCRYLGFPSDVDFQSEIRRSLEKRRNSRGRYGIRRFFEKEMETPLGRLVPNGAIDIIERLLFNSQYWHMRSFIVGLRRTI